MKSIFTVIALSILTITSASASPRQVLVTVGKENASKIWAKETCDFLHQSINDSSEGNISTNCVWLQHNELVNENVARESRSGKYLFQLDLRELFSGTRSLRAVNLNREDDTDFTQLAWKIEHGPTSNLAIHKLIKNIFKVDLYKDEIKTFFLANGLKDSNLVAINKKGKFFDKNLETEISPAQAYKAFAEESPKNKHYLRAALEIVGSVGLGVVDYYNKKEINARDWDFPTVSESIESRLVNGKAYRMDDNSLKTNTGHAYAGTIYYMLARSNGLNSMESFLYTFTASSAWEFIAEFREVVSINDQIITPLGGFAIGEGFHQIAKIFGKQGNSVVDKTLNAIFDTPSAFHKWVDKNSHNRDISSTGFDNDFWSRFDIEASMVKNSNNKVVSKIGVEAEIINIAEYEKSGKVSKVITDTVFTRMIAAMPHDSNAGEELKFVMRNALAAYYNKNLGKDAKGQLTGYNFFIGPSNGFEFNSKDRDNDNVDFMTVVNVLGGTMDLTLYTSGYRIRATIDIFADFALMRSYAISPYKAQKGADGIASVIADNDYYYAKGMSSALRASVEKGRISFGASLEDKRFSSVNGHYRDQERVTSDLELKDKKSELEIWIAYQVSKSVQTKVSFSNIKREGSIKDFGIFETSQKRIKGTLVYNFK